MAEQQEFDYQQFDDVVKGCTSRLSEYKQTGTHTYPMVCPECESVTDVTMTIHGRANDILSVAKHREEGCPVGTTRQVVVQRNEIST